MEIIKLIDKKEDAKLYQWDLDRQVKITLPKGIEADEVHFAHLKDKEALVVRIKDIDGILVADIPNILLQSNQQYIKAWLVSGNQTICTRNLIVIERAKPADYVYTETEILSYRKLSEEMLVQMEELEKEFNIVSNKRVPLPLTAEGNPEVGTEGQMLVSNGDGSTRWIDNLFVEKPKAQSATAIATFDGEIIDIDKCLYTFTKTEREKHYVISNQTTDGNDAYLSCTRLNNANSASSTIIELTRYADPVFSFWDHATNNGGNNAGYLRFHQTESSDGKYLIYDRHSTPINGVYFEIYTKSELASENSPIPGYTLVTALDAIEDGGKYLIASLADDGHYYILHPSLETTPYSHVAKVVLVNDFDNLCTEEDFNAFKEEVNAMLGSYATDVVNLIGGIE